MASITRKIKKGRPYYYAVESKRIDGKPRKDHITLTACLHVRKSLLKPLRSAKLLDEKGNTRLNDLTA
jgi:hypothetical protein